MRQSKAFKAALIGSGALTAGICAVMNFLLIPRIEAAAGGLRCFDMHFGYRYDDAVRFLTALTPAGRGTYLHAQLPLDFLYPVAYAVFFALAITALLRRKSVLIGLPVLLALFDYCENVSVVRMLKAETLSPALAAFAGAVTEIKTILMYICFMTLLILLVRRLILRKKSQT